MDEIEVFYTTDEDGVHIRCILCKWEYIAEACYPSTKLSELTSKAEKHDCKRKANSENRRSTSNEDAITQTLVHDLGRELRILLWGKKCKVDQLALLKRLDKWAKECETFNAHSYISTACHHDSHSKCRLHCKFCRSLCECPCHE